MHDLGQFGLFNPSMPPTWTANTVTIAIFTASGVGNSTSEASSAVEMERRDVSSLITMAGDAGAGLSSSLARLLMSAAS